MLTVRLFSTSLVLMTLVLSLLIFFNHYQKEKDNSASLVSKTVRSNLSQLSYYVSKNIKNKRDVKKLRATMDRIKASNDLLQDIFITDGHNVLLSTNFSRIKVPVLQDYFLAEGTSALQALEQKKIFHQNIYYYDKNIRQKLDLFMTLNQKEIDVYMYNEDMNLMITLATFVFLFSIFMYYLISHYVIRPLEKLRQYAYYQSYLPKKFFLRELEYIRSSMFQTFDRLEKEKKELYKLSRTDSLSGLANREALNERLALLISLSKRDDKEFALLFLDLDHFKSVNDSLGHKIGDMLLQEIASNIQKVVRDNDIVARVGGDEFIIVLSQYSSMIELVKVIDRIQEYLKNPFVVNDKLLEITSSVGIAFYPKDGLDEVDLIKKADIAMYQAKKDGRNQYHFFKEEFNIKLQEEIKINREMREALRNNEFEMYYQPKTNVKSGKIIGCEALIRWNHPSRGLIFPDAFIELAERDGFIIELGAWILKKSINQQVAWKKQEICDIPISINVSVKQLLHKNFEEEFKSVILKSGIDPCKIDIEIVESLFLINTKNSSYILDMIHDIGATVSLDDFGTGYSSLSYLKHFTVDTLKVDKIFVDDFHTELGSIFLETIIKMGQTLKLKVLCEGVETQEQLNYLKKLNCELYQGYLHSKPIPVQDFEKLYLSSLEV